MHRLLPDNTQHSQETDVHVRGVIRTRSPSKRAAADPRLRRHGNWDRLCGMLTPQNPELHRYASKAFRPIKSAQTRAILCLRCDITNSLVTGPASLAMPITKPVISYRVFPNTALTDLLL